MELFFLCGHERKHMHVNETNSACYQTSNEPACNVILCVKYEKLFYIIGKIHSSCLLQRKSSSFQCRLLENFPKTSANFKIMRNLDHNFTSSESFSPNSRSCETSYFSLETRTFARAS